ncbi:MAG: protoheme IX farnesyltransferase [Rhodospirillales bacterium]|nr:protoheme IX farnesyltransferase [Rhodospirillales bacterium]MCB9996187.1 protoheme IX farnesyltransferase [Rhodospirillales bacterium]
MSDMSSITNAEQDSSIRDFFDLLKPRVMSLVVFSGFAGMWIAPGFSAMHPFLIGVAVLALAIGAGAAGAINMWYERDIDAVMKRTSARPLPRGRVHPDEALTFAVTLSLLSVLTMGVALNWLAAGLLAAANLFYVFIYTIWLKRRTPHNIVIGGAAGAFPPMIGWAAVTGDITLLPVILFTIIFLWTPPHFWALSLFANEDYKRAKIPMLPTVAGEKTTKIQMLAYTVILLPLAASPAFLGYAGWGYGIASLALGGFFVFAALRVLRDTTLKSARLMFGYSVFYLFALLLALMMDKV